MIINQINSAVSGTTTSSKDLLNNRIGYNYGKMITGDAPIDRVSLSNGNSYLPSSASWHSVCYGNGKFVAVSYNTNISAYSTDGINWTQTTLPSSAKWQSVCYGNGKYVAVAYNSNKSAYKIIYSYDGLALYDA